VDSARIPADLSQHVPHSSVVGFELLNSSGGRHLLGGLLGLVVLKPYTDQIASAPLDVCFDGLLLFRQVEIEGGWQWYVLGDRYSRACTGHIFDYAGKPGRIVVVAELRFEECPRSGKISYGVHAKPLQG
jgi:hypothetical protein